MNSYNGFSPTQRYRALAWLKAEWASGRRVKPSACDVCGQTDGSIEAHSEDYSEPFGDHIGRHGLCYRCHMMIHCRFKNPEAWLAYVGQVRDGWQFEPFRGRDFRRFVVDHLENHGHHVPHVVGPARGETLLDSLTLGKP